MSDIPSEAPLSDEARRLLAQSGIVSMEKLAGVAYAAPADFERLVGKDAMESVRRYIEKRYPALVPGADASAARNFPLGARMDEVPKGH